MLEVNKSIRVTTVFKQSELDAFSDISGDHNPIHTPKIYELYPEHKQGVIVQGMLAASRFGAVLGSDFPGAGTINVERSFQFRSTIYVDKTYVMELRLASVDVSKHSATLLLNMYSEEGRLCIEGRTEVINERVFTDDNYHTVSESNEVLKGKCIQLPPPTEDSVMVLSEVMGNRRSVRYFQSTAMDMQSLSNLLQTAGGLTKVSESGTSKKYFYTNPTASNHQEVEIFVFTAEAVFRYIPNGHSLTQILDCDCRRELGKMPFLKTAPVSLCLVSNLKKMVHHTDNYRRDMYSAMDIGYVSQNIYLHCAAHNMATVACGMIDRERIAELLGLTQEKVMLVHPIGIRKTISNE